jgi:hypothetical protein
MKVEKLLIKYLLVGSALSVLLLAPNPAKAQGGFTVTIDVDENCNGTLTNSSGFSGALPCGLQQDTGPGGLNNVLTYDLLNPPGLVAGDLLMYDPDGVTLSDVIRFNPQQVGPGGGTGVLAFYSNPADGPDGLADTPTPPAAFYANFVSLTEQGADPPAFVSYTPIAGEPGFVAGAGGPVTYNIVSDVAAPEPGSIVLMFGGVGALFARKYLTRRAR